jgi:hypothetical protein
MVFVGPGGTPDIIARLIGQALTQRLGQSVLVEKPAGRRRQSRTAGGRARTRRSRLLWPTQFGPEQFEMARRGSRSRLRNQPV